MRTQIITLKHGFQVGGQKLVDIVMREPVVADMMAAERMAGNGGNIAFRSALIATCIDKVDGFDAPVTLNMIGELKLADYNLLVDGLSELEEEGEAEAKKE